MRFAKYNGEQKAWPTGSAFSDQVVELPVYRGWPEKPYEVLGYIEFDKADIEWNDGDIKQAATMAKELGGEAVLVIRKGEAPSQNLTSLRNDIGMDGSRTAVVVLRWK